MAATIFEGAKEVLESIWAKNHRIWPEWLWDVSPATVEIVRKKKSTDKKKDKPLIAAGRNRIVVWTNRELHTLEKALVPSCCEGWKVIVEIGSQLACERYLQRLEDQQAAQPVSTEEVN